MTLKDLKDNVNKFSISQMLSNNDGKSSATATIGSLICVAGVIGFLFGCIDFSYISGKNDIMFYAGGVITLGSSVLTANKLAKGSSMFDEAAKSAKLKTDETNTSTTEEPKIDQINS